MVRTCLAASVVCLLACHQASAIDKEGLLSKYRDKIAVVITEGISTGFCGVTSTGKLGIRANLLIRIVAPGDIQMGRVVPCAEPVRKGELLRVFHVSFHSGGLLLYVENVSPHAIDRGVGAFAHQSLEQGSALIQFRAGKDGKDLDAADKLVAMYLKPFDRLPTLPS